MGRELGAVRRLVMASTGAVFLAGVGSVAMALTVGFMAAVWLTSPNGGSRPDNGGVTRQPSTAEMPLMSMQQPSPAPEPGPAVRMVTPTTTGQAEATAPAPATPNQVKAKGPEARKAARKKKRHAKRAPGGWDSPAASSYAQQNGFWR